MSKITNTIIYEKAADIFAHGGLGEFRIRLLAKNLGVVPSVIYHYFSNEDELLKNMFDYLNSELGRKRSQLTSAHNTSDMLKQRIEFQLDNATAIVAVLKYYLAFRKTFPKRKDGFVPDKSALHMEEVLRFAKSKGDYTRTSLQDDAKVMTHAVNGFLLEYYPHVLVGKEKTALISKIHNFLLSALKGGEHS